jgi:hypothetical protein
MRYSPWVITREERVPRKGFVYFIGPLSEGPVKIGASTNPSVRLTTLRNASPDEVYILGLIPADDCFAEERAIHARFGSLHIRGEWFRRSEELSALISQFATPIRTRHTQPSPGSVRVDHRGRISLGKAARVSPGDVFFIDVEADGSITLSPATVVPLGSLDVTG